MFPENFKIIFSKMFEININRTEKLAWGHNFWIPLEFYSTTKPTNWPMRPAKTQISLGIHQVWSVSSLCALWSTKGPMLLHADSEHWSDWADAQADLSFCWVHRLLAHLSRRLTRWAYRMGLEPVSVRPCVCARVRASTLSNMNISKTSRPITTKFYLKHH